METAPISHPVPVSRAGVAEEISEEGSAGEEPDFPPIMSPFGQLEQEASQILPNLFLSDALTARWGGTLDRLEITHIISVLEEPITFSRTKHPLKLLHIPASDDVNTDLLSFMDQTTKFIKEAIETSKREQEQLETTSLNPAAATTDGESPMLLGLAQENRVLVHCLAGVSRSATIVIAYLLATTAMTAEEATEFVRSKRSIVRPNYGFTKQLEQYERRYFASTGKTATPKKRVGTDIASRMQLYRDVVAGVRRE
jgi:atypical dual specificity phosphatase